MSRTNPLHDNPRSKEIAGQREAKKGDIERFDDEDEPRESMGTLRKKKGANHQGIQGYESPDDLDVKEMEKERDKDVPGYDKRDKRTWPVRAKDTPDKDDGETREYFKRKSERPMS